MRQLAGLGFALTMLAIAPQAPAAVSLTDTVIGSTVPALIPSDQSLQNGDFLIGANPAAPFTGDGADEPTTWTFEFTALPQFNMLMSELGAPDGALTSAVLSITITTFFSPGPPADIVRPMDLFPSIGIPLALGDPNPQTGTFAFDLLDSYSRSDLVNFLAAHGGAFPMIYADDAIVSAASLTLSSVPSTGSCVLLAAAGIAGLARRRR